MSSDKPIIVLGFGRSGTTWLSDIISKYTGDLILFEPFHNGLYKGATDYLYQESTNVNSLIEHWENIISTPVTDSWLLRNHINRPLEQVNSDFVNEIWSNSQTIGFKSIRLSFNFSPFVKKLNAQSLFIIRHPLSVIASIINRDNFWEDVGWSNHWALFSKAHFKGLYSNIIRNVSSKEECIAIMWCLSNKAGLHSLQKLNSLPVFYEDLYAQPYNYSKQILTSLGLYDHSIHPAHLFTPSMLSLKTIHDIYPKKTIQNSTFHEFFWEKTLSPGQINNINEVIRQVCNTDPTFEHLCLTRGYIT